MIPVRGYGLFYGSILAVSFLMASIGALMVDWGLLILGTVMGFACLVGARFRHFRRLRGIGEKYDR